MSQQSSGADNSSSSARSPLGRLAEEFVERFRRGEHPALTEYTEQYPDLADEIRELFPVLVEMEQLKSDGDGRACPSEGDATRTRAPVERLGDYVILREVGRGGMGVVYEAEQESLGRHVALKVLPATALLNPDTILRFRREARSAAQLHHTNIVPVFGVGEHEGVQYYVMQFIRGRGLDEVIGELRQLRRVDAPGPLNREGIRRATRSAVDHTVSAAEVAQALATGHFARLPPETADPGTDSAPSRPADHAAAHFAPDAPTAPIDAPRAGSAPIRSSPGPSVDGSSSASRGLFSEFATPTSVSRHYWRGVAQIGLQVARALEYAHSQGILHRDIKPSNLLLDLRGMVWVTDFGLAKAIADVDLTHTGDIVGTLRYMAPERFNGWSDARSDLYALGLTLYELLTLRPAFDAPDRNRLIHQVNEGEPTRPRKIAPEIPRDLETICLKCIEKQPSRRYSSALALADDLDRWLEGRPIAARRVSSLERGAKWARRKPALAGLLAFSTASMVGGLILTSTYNLRLSRTLAESLRQQRVAERSAYIANLNLTRVSIEVGDIASALAGLDRLDPEDSGANGRGFEWHYLRRLCDYELVGRWKTGTPIESLAHSPDGRRLATGHGYSTGEAFDDRPGEVQVRDTETGQLLLKWSAHRGPVFDVAFSPDGRWIATGGGDGLAKIWVASSGQLSRTLGEQPFEVNSVAFSPDGRWVATGSGGRYPPGNFGPGFERPGTVAVWDAATGAQSWHRDDRLGGVSSVEFSPDGSKLAWGGRLYLKISDPASGRILDQPAFEGGGFTAFSADGRWMGNYGNGGHLFLSENGAPRTHTKAANVFGWASDMSFQPPDGKYFAMAFAYAIPGYPDLSRIRARKRLAQIWGTSRFQPILVLTAHEADIRDLEYRPPDGNRLATADADGVVLTWKSSRAKPAASIRQSPSIVRAMAFHPGGRELATASVDGVVRVEGLDEAGPRSERKRHEHIVFALAYSPDGGQLASAGQDMTIRIAPPGDAGTPRALQGHTGPVQALAYRPDGRQLASASDDGTVRLWDPADSRPPRILAGHSGNVLGIAYSPDGRRLASVGGDGIARLWAAESGRLLRSWPAHSGTIQVVTFVGSDPRTLATAGVDVHGNEVIQVIRLWNSDDGSLIRELKGHKGEVFALARTGVGPPRLVSAGKDQTVRVWDPETGLQILELLGHNADIFAVAFSPDGRLLATAGKDRSIRLWDGEAAPFSRTEEKDWKSSISESPRR